MENSIIIIILALLASALFSGMEIAYVSSNKLRLELEMQKGGTTSRSLRHFLENPSSFLSGILVGNNIALVIFSIYMAGVIQELLMAQPVVFFYNHFVIFLIQTFISTGIVLVFAEFIPKVLFRINPDRLLSGFTLPFVFIYYLLFPLIWLVMTLAEGILRLFFRISLERDEPLYSRFDLFHMVKENQASDEEENPDVDAQIFKNALEFSEVKVKECMIPRTEIKALEINQSVGDVREKFIESGHSKLIIYRENIDNIVGYIHLIDLFDEPENISEKIRSCPFITESMFATELLRTFIEKRKSLGVVLDEFGGTAGIVTVEDLIEEIFGEIEDEHDHEALTEKKLSPYEYLFSGRLEVDYLNEKYQLSLPEGDYETLAGLTLQVLEKIPEENEVFYYKGFEFTIHSVEQTKVDEIKVKKLQSNEIFPSNSTDS